MSLRALLPTDAWVRWLLVPAVAFIALASNTSYLADFWHHLARGRAIVEDGRLLNHDIFTCTVAGQPFQDVNWLSQVIYFQLFDAGGLALVRVVNAALVALTLLWLVAICRRASGSLPVALGVGVAVFFGLWDVLTIRPQTFSLLLFVAMYDLLERSERRPWLLALPTLLMALWPNLHGAFPAGLMLIGCWWLAAGWTAWRLRTRESLDHLRPLTACFMVSTLATLANPYGWGIYFYVGQTSNLAAARGIDEWLPPGFDTMIGLAFYASLAILVGIVMACRMQGGQLASGSPLNTGSSSQHDEEGNWVSTRELLLIGCFGFLAVGSVRMVAWWLIAIAPMLASRIVILWPNAKSATQFAPNRGAAFSVVGLLLAMVLSVPGLQRFNPLLALRFVDATTIQMDEAQLILGRELGQAHVFARFEWGEYLTWAAHPRFKVFMDGRIEIYPNDVWQDYAAVTCGQPGWAGILDDHHIDALLLDAQYHRRTGLLDQVERSAHWQKRHQVGDVLVFVRSRSLAKS